MPRAVKAMALLRDPRVAIHGPTHDPVKSGRWRGEAKIAGRAVEVESEGDGHTFQVEIEEAVITRLGDKGLVIESWHPTGGHRVIERE